MKFVAFGSPRDDAFQHVGQPGQRFDVVQLRCLDQAGDDGPMPPTTIGPSKKGIFSAKSHRAHRSLDRVGVQLQPAIIDEQNQAFPMVQRVSDCLRQGRTTGDTRELGGEPCVHRLDQGTAALLANLPASMPASASAFYARNISALLLGMVKDGALNLDFSDEVTAATVITNGGAVVQEATKKLLEGGAA